MNGYARRAIRLTFRVGEGQFGLGGANTVTVENLRVSAAIQYAMMPTTASAAVRVSGLTLDTINKLTTASLNWKTRADTEIAVEAGDFGGQMSVVFNGNIIRCAPDFSSQPDVALMVTAIAGREIAMKPVSPTTFNAAVPAPQAAQQIMQGAGYTVQNLGVNAVLAYPYFQGTTLAQARSLLDAAYAHGALDPITKTLRIWPKVGDVQNADLITISPQNGMIGYPEVDYNTVKVRTLFNPAIVGGPGKKIQVSGSQLKPANGTWIISRVDYLLEAETPGGAWETIVEGYRDASAPETDGWLGNLAPGVR